MTAGNFGEQTVGEQPAAECGTQNRKNEKLFK